MGDKGGRKSKEKSQKQTNIKHKQLKKDKLEKQQRGQAFASILSEKNAGKR